MKMNRIAAAVAGVAILAGAALSANAAHSWANYHWARTANPFTLQTLDSTVNVAGGPQWKTILGQSAADWTASSVLNLNVVPYANSSRDRKRCTAVSGKIRACNAAYGNNGWLGLASINLTGGHISQGTAKMNDSYASTWANNLGEDRHVLCQEVGHLFGISHTSEDGSSQNTCMDYSTTKDGITSTKPNQHDYDLLVSMYSHLDSTTTVSSSSAASLTAEQQSMAGQNPMGVRIQKSKKFEIWAAADGRGGTWIHRVILAN